MVTTDPSRPIGIFDSGLGGLTVARAVIDHLPRESIVYYGDNGRYPYGTKPLADVHRYATEIIDHLLADGVKLVVVGCNSASSALWRLGRPKLPVPLVTVINPPAQTAVRLTRNGRIGVIGTPATIESGQYEEAIALTRRPVEVVSEACPDFVRFVETGETTGPQVMEAARNYLEPMKRAGVDTLILGCTHYPLLSATIQYVMGPDVLLVSSAEETAKDVYTVLVANDMLSANAEASYEFRTSGDEHEFQRLGHRFLGPEIATVKRHPLG
ncbi:MAG TPA: glutamate racemase [Actinomycetota bacterium]|nr:glutamate racemase [Actinomycetota bacterium]